MRENRRKLVKWSALPPVPSASQKESREEEAFQDPLGAVQQVRYFRKGFFFWLYRNDRVIAIRTYSARSCIMGRRNWKVTAENRWKVILVGLRKLDMLNTPLQPVCPLWKCTKHRHTSGISTTINTICIVYIHSLHMLVKKVGATFSMQILNKCMAKKPSLSPKKFNPTCVKLEAWPQVRPPKHNAYYSDCVGGQMAQPGSLKREDSPF